MSSAFVDELIQFIDLSPTPFHAAEQLCSGLRAAGFVRLHESEAWQLEAGTGYFVTRNDSSVIAWRQPDSFSNGIRLVGAHTDSPCLKVKPNPELNRKGYHQLGVEVYGGALLNPWFDRDLSLAGRVTFRSEDGSLRSELIDFKDPIATIPSLAIHLDREANSNRTINAQQHLPVLLGQGDSEFDLRQALQARIDAQDAQVLDYDLCFYDTQPASVVGLNGEFVAASRLDNLLSCFVGMKALVESDSAEAQALICTDHEEVGSQSACGAQGPMLEHWLTRVIPDAQERIQAIAKSLLISADNAHAVHPNYSDKHDENHGPKINAGPVIKINANQRYATNSETAAYFRHFAEQAGVPVQSFVVRSDMGCGSTIGPITASEVGIRTVDVGAPQFAMHSIRELAGTEDCEGLCKILVRFYAASDLI